MRVVKALSALIAVVLVGAIFYALTTEPIGIGDTTSPAVAAAVSDHPGEATYRRLCEACHATGAAGAPLLGNKDAWGRRLAQGLDAMLQTVISGKGAMPPRGTCAGCSDEDLKAAIEFMVSKVQ